MILKARVVLDDDTVLTEQTLDVAASNKELTVLAESAGDLAAAYARNGARVRLQVMDPDGDIHAPGEWVTIGVVDPNGDDWYDPRFL